MNFPLNNLTTKDNLNFFSTPKFKDIYFDKDKIKKNDNYTFDLLLKNPSLYGSKIMQTKKFKSAKNRYYK